MRLIKQTSDLESKLKGEDDSSSKKRNRKLRHGP